MNNLEIVKEKMKNNFDFTVKNIKVLGVKVSILYLNNMVDCEQINKLVLEPLLKLNFDKTKNLKDFYECEIIENEEIKKSAKKFYALKNHSTNITVDKEKKETPQNSFSYFLEQNGVFLTGFEYLDDYFKAMDGILRGDACIFIENGKEILRLSTANIPERSIGEPPTSSVILGPREGFVESCKTNVTLIRKRLVTTNLHFDQIIVGRYTKTKVIVSYIENIADMKVVNKIKKIIEDIDVDGILDSSYIIDFLSERPYSMFKQVGKYEKPDIIVSKLLEGRIAIIVDGSPIVLTVPFIFLEDLQNSDDYYQRNYRIIMVRYLRLVGVIIALMLPGFYVAVEQYHYRVIPIKFLITILNSIQGLPLTPFIEICFVTILFEILYEASVRMPKYLGMALSIVGALILGDTAVKAGLVSSPAVMIVAISGLTIYMAPDQSAPLSVIRIFFTILGGVLGIFGLLAGALFILSYMVALNSYGTPYLAPVAPHIKDDLKDAFNKETFIMMNKRPKAIVKHNIRRQKI